MVTGERGPQGNQGNRGETGATGMSRAKRQGVVWLFVVSLALSVANLFWTSHEVNANNAAQQQQQLAQQRAGQLAEQKICTTLGTLAALKPPPGNPQSNPSRAYLQEEHDTLAQLGTDLGCGHATGERVLRKQSSASPDG